MRKHILIPTDFSDNAWSATVYALKLFANEECTFHFIHSTKMKVSTMSNFSNRLLNVMSENALRDLNELKDMAETSDANANHEFNIILSSHDLESAINSAIHKYDIDLIIMGTKGVTSAKDKFFGSNTVSIVKNISECPVLIVPDEFDFVIPKQIAFPTDFSRFYGEELVPIKELADLFNAKIRVVHITEDNNLTEQQNYNLAMLKANLEDYPHSFHWMPEYEKKSEEINDFIKELGINVLTMVNYKHSFIEAIVNEPIVKKIGFNPIVPFLVIPHANEYA